MLESTTTRVDRLEGNFKKLTEFIKDAFVEMGKTIHKGNRSMESKIDELFENIGENNLDLGKIKAGQKMRENVVKWCIGALKQTLSIVISVVTLYFIFKYGGT